MFRHQDYIAARTSLEHVGWMPVRLVIRRNVEWKQDASPLRAYIDGAIIAEPGLRTVDQCISSLLREYEGCEGNSDTRSIRKNGQVVGYIEITLEARNRIAPNNCDSSLRLSPDRDAG